MASADRIVVQAIGQGYLTVLPEAARGCVLECRARLHEVMADYEHNHALLALLLVNAEQDL